MRGTRASVLTIAVTAAALGLAGCSSSSTSTEASTAASSAPTAAASDAPSMDTPAGNGEMVEMNADAFGADFAKTMDAFYSAAGERSLVGTTPANAFQGDSIVTLNPDGSAFGEVQAVEGGAPGQQIGCNVTTCYSSDDGGATWTQFGPASAIQPPTGADMFLQIQSLNAGTGADTMYRSNGAGVYEVSLPDGTLTFTFTADGYTQSGELRDANGNVTPMVGTYGYGDVISLPENLPTD